MHLAEDHTRPQHARAVDVIDSVQHLHSDVLPYAHPDLYSDFLDRAGGTPNLETEVET